MFPSSSLSESRWSRKGVLATTYVTRPAQKSSRDTSVEPFQKAAGETLNLNSGTSSEHKAAKTIPASRSVDPDTTTLYILHGSPSVSESSHQKKKSTNHPNESDESENEVHFAGIGKMTRNHRATKWATNAEIKAQTPSKEPEWGSESKFNDTTRHNDTAWETAPRSQWGIDAMEKVANRVDDATSKLMNWDGSWAPGVVDWDYRDNDDETYAFGRITLYFRHYQLPPPTIDLKDWTTNLKGTIAPRDWIPTTIDSQDRSNWWNVTARNWEEQKENDEDENHNSKAPFWSYFTSPTSVGLDEIEVPEAKLDPKDNDSKSFTQTAESSILEYGIKKMKRHEKHREQHKETRRAAKFLESYVPARNEYSPKVNIYLRPLERRDLVQVTQIWNWYIMNHLCSPERDRLSVQVITGRYEDIHDALLPFLVAVDRSSNSLKNQKSPADTPSEHIVGFSFADDFNDRGGMYRYTVELEMYVKPTYLRNGIGRCLMDRMMLILDEQYLDRAGYEFIGSNTEYSSGGRRNIGNIVIHVPYDAKDDSTLCWVRKWLEQWDFMQSGEYREIGLKKRLVVSLAILTRKTGTHIDPWAP